MRSRGAIRFFLNLRHRLQGDFSWCAVRFCSANTKKALKNRVGAATRSRIAIRFFWNLRRRLQGDFSWCAVRFCAANTKKALKNRVSAAP